MSFPGDLRYTLRTWSRDPGVVAVAAISLALGIGANTSMFSVINSVRQYQLDFENPDRLVVVWNTNLDQGYEWVPSFETIAALLDSGGSFESFGFFQMGGAPVTLTSSGAASRVSQQPIDLGIFSVLGVEPLLGRSYRSEDLDDLIKQKEVRSVVISFDTWQRRLRADPDVIGKTIRVDGEPRPVIGVMPEGFSISPWVGDVGFWAANDLTRIPEGRWMAAVGRLKPGVTLEQAGAETTTVTRSVLESRGEDGSAWTARVETLHDAYFARTKDQLTFLLGAVSFVLLIACANVANLQLARGAMRQKELGIRASLGADRKRLVKLLLTESLALALLGGVVGVLFAFWGNQIFAALVPQGFPDFLRDVYVDIRVLGFTLLLSLVTGLVFGLLPALQASRVDFADVLKEGGRGSGSGRSRGRALLLVSEVALSMVLLVGAGVMMRGFLKEQSDLPGFDTENLLTADILLGGDKYFAKIPGDKNRVTPECVPFFECVLDGVRALPGVRSAGIVSRLPMWVWYQGFAIVGRPPPEPGKEPMADLNEVDSGLFETLGIPLLRGRSFDRRDGDSGAWVVIINKTFAERHFQDEDPLGQAIRITLAEGVSGIRVEEPRPREIVGIVADVTYPSFHDQAPAAMYVPYRQHLWEFASEDQWLHTRKMLVLRTSVNPLNLVGPVEKLVERVDGDQAAHDFMTMERRIAGSYTVQTSRFLAQLFGIFGALAMLLAMVGVYGVMSFFVGQRYNELGIRMALGATTGNLLSMLLWQSLKTILVGVAFGLGGGLALSSSLNSMFWGLPSADPAAFGGVTAMMIAAALLAAYVPAQRVTKLAPQSALRYE